jgi:hypothetical protein
MTEHESTIDTKRAAALSLLTKQRSHVLFVLSNAKVGRESVFLEWYRGTYHNQVLDDTNVLRGQQYEQHEKDITQGKYPRLPFHYLGLYELSLDGAQQAERLIERVTTLHSQQPAAEAPATWLYYPACEKIGRSPSVHPSPLTLAYANGVPSQENEFREWYATRHIRHAMNITALVSGQCFERTQFQRPGAMEAVFATIAVYEQQDSLEAILESAASLPPDTLRFPMLDRSRFAECVYLPV